MAANSRPASDAAVKKTRAHLTGFASVNDVLHAAQLDHVQLCVATTRANSFHVICVAQLTSSSCIQAFGLYLGKIAIRNQAVKFGTNESELLYTCATTFVLEIVQRARIRLGVQKMILRQVRPINTNGCYSRLATLNV